MSRQVFEDSDKRVVVAALRRLISKLEDFIVDGVALIAGLLQISCAGDRSPMRWPSS